MTGSSRQAGSLSRESLLRVSIRVLWDPHQANCDPPEMSQHQAVQPKN